jgi:hypothetical protein
MIDGDPPAMPSHVLSELQSDFAEVTAAFLMSESVGESVKRMDGIDNRPKVRRVDGPDHLELVAAADKATPLL